MSPGSPSGIRELNRRLTRRESNITAAAARAGGGGVVAAALRERFFQQFRRLQSEHAVRDNVDGGHVPCLATPLLLSPL